MNLLLDLSSNEVELIRRALRDLEEAHKRNGFDGLERLVADLRSKISDAILDNHFAGV